MMPSMPSHASHPKHRRGSIYFVVLVTIAVVTTMVLIGAALRKTQTARYRIGTDTNAARHAARSAAESALAQLEDDPTRFVETAKTGTILADTPIGDATMTLTAKDKDTGLLVTGSTTTVQVIATGQSADARSLIGFDLQSQSAYPDLLLSKGASSYWKLDEPTDDSVAADTFGVIDGAYHTPHDAGLYTFLDGDPSPKFHHTHAAVEIPHDASFEVRRGTVVFWTRIEDVTSPSVQGLLCKESDPTKPVVLFRAMYVENSELVFIIDSDNDTFDREYRVDGSVFVDKDWHHIAWSFGTRGIMVYIDGTRVIDDNSYIFGLHIPGAFGSPDKTNTEPWILGARRDGKNGKITNPLLDGSIARFAFIPSQLDDAEIAELMDGQLNAVKFATVEGSFERVVE